MATLVAAYTSTTTTCPSRRPSQLSHNHHHHPRRYSNNNRATTFSSNPTKVLAIPFSTMSKDSIATTGTMKSETDDSSNPQEQEEQPQIRTVKKSALKSSIKRQQQDQREDSSCDDGNSIATPTGSLPQPRAVRFSPGVSSTTTGTSLEEYATLPDLPPSSYGGTRQPLGRKARQAQVRKLLHLASQRDSESGALVPIPSKDSQLS